MRKFKLSALVLGTALALGVGAGIALNAKEALSVSADTTAEFTLSSAADATVDGVTASFAKGSGSSNPAWYPAGLRLYANNTVTISSSSAITSIVFNWEKQGSKAFASVTANVGTYTHPSAAGEGSWTGEATEVVFTLGGSGQLQLNTFTVTTGGAQAQLTGIEVSGAMTKTAYYVGESWSPAGFTVTAHYDDDSNKDVTANATWTYNPASPALNVTSVVATATFGGLNDSSNAQVVSVSRTNPIQVLYTKTSGASVDVYGYYVGFLDGTGPVIMDGAYGIVVYNKTADVSGYTANETILHVTGSISIYKGLYEIGSASMSIASGTYDAPDTPVVYSTTGSETADYASRLTTVSGTPTLTSGNFEDAAGTSDIKMNFTVGTKTVQVFYKKAAQTADAEAFAAIKDAVANSTEITIKGFTGWYDGFQVQMNGYVPTAENYTAEDFAQDLLDQTDAVCTGYQKGDNNHDAIEAIWNDLQSDDKYPALPAGEKTILGDADANEEGTVVEQAMARYDYLTARYNLSNFINGRTPAEVGYINTNIETNNGIALIVIAAVALVSVASVVTIIVIKRKSLNR